MGEVQKLKVKIKENNGVKLAWVENKWCEVFKESPLNYFVIYNGERRLLNKKTGELVNNKSENAHNKRWFTPKCKSTHKGGC